MQTARPSPWSAGAFDNPFETPPPAQPAPVVDVRGCKDCFATEGVAWLRSGRPVVHCRIAGTLAVEQVNETPAGCPLRSGPVTLRLVDRGRP